MTHLVVKGIKLSDNQLAASDATVSGKYAAYTKVKELTITLPTTVNALDVYLRIYWQMSSPGSGITVYGKVYKNDVAVGVEKSDSSGAYVAFTDDIANWSNGDKIQLYGYASEIASNSGWQLFRIKGTLGYQPLEVSFA